MRVSRWCRQMVIALAVAMVVAGFADSREVSAVSEDIMNLPMPKYFIPATQPDGKEMYVFGADIENEIRGYSPGLKKVYFNKQLDKFIVPEPRWIVHLLDTYKELLSSLNIQGQSQTWDCENYSSFLNTLMTVKIWQAGYWDTHAAFGWVKVNAKKEWAGIPGELHALMFAVTAKGVFIIEPQNGQYTHISKYPNNTYIEEVYLF